MAHRTSLTCLVVVGSALVFSGLSACGSDGTTPRCPPRDLYDISNPDEATSTIVQEQRRDALLADKGPCITALGTATSGNTPPPSGGSGSGGSGSGGSPFGTSSGGAGGAGGAGGGP